MSDRVQMPFDPKMFPPPHDGTGPGPAWTTDSDGMVYLRCGQCRRIMGSPLNHSIDPDGTVNASIVCVECGWHVFGRLLSWPGLRMEPKQAKILDAEVLSALAAAKAKDTPSISEDEDKGKANE
jgi:hypothetical protein